MGIKSYRIYIKIYSISRPFLCTAGAVIDVKNGTLTLCVGDNKSTFTLTSALKSPMLENTCCMIDVTGAIVQDELPQVLLDDPLEAVLMLEASEREGHVEIDSLILELVGKANSRDFEVTNTITPYDKPQVKKLELKRLPSSLKYVFLDDDESRPMIVSSNLMIIKFLSFLLCCVCIGKLLGIVLMILRELAQIFACI